MTVKDFEKEKFSLIKSPQVLTKLKNPYEIK